MVMVMNEPGATAFREAINAGRPVVVQFNAHIDSTELCADAGWLARVVDISKRVDRDQVETYAFTFDYAPFESHNDTMASRNYFDSNGNPTLTAKEAGFYSPREEWEFLPNDILPFKVVEEETGNDLSRDARLAALEQKYAALEARLAAMEGK